MKRLTLLFTIWCAVSALLVVSTASAAMKVTIIYRLDSAWESGFQANFTIKNRAAAALPNWELEFDSPHNLTSIWDAEIVSHTATHYVIRGAAWNQDIPARAQVNFGFVAQTVGALSSPKNCKLNGVPVKCNGKTRATATPTKKPRKTRTPARTATLTPTRTATRAAAFTPTRTATRAAAFTPTRAASFTPTPTPGNSVFPARVFAPYVDILLWPTPNLAQFAQQTGVKHYTLAFMVSRNGCSAAWGGVIPLADNFYQTEMDALRQSGGDVIVSFGGANGVELAQSCGTTASLQAQYQAVIEAYHLTHLDFDIEGAAIEDTASVDRRNKAIAALQAEARAQNKTLDVSFTLPVLPTGLTWQGVALLQNALANGVEISTVNIMAMDYGGAAADPYRMGDNAIAALNSLHAQLQPLYPNKTDAQIWRMLGVTPMIGLNDVHPEVFTLSDAQQVLQFAQQKNIARLAMWSMSRDQSCPNNGAYVAPDCSGIVQAPWAFSNVFEPFTQ